jgi:transposase-like protein
LVELRGVSRRSLDPIELTEHERRELEAVAGRLTAPFRMVQRARIVLYAAQGLTNVEIAGRLDTAPEVVAKWRRRFRLERLEGLRDRPRAGRPRRFSPAGNGAGQGDRVRAAARARRPAVAVLQG